MLLLPQAAHVQDAPKISPYATRAEAAMVILLARGGEGLPASGSAPEAYLKAAAQLGIVEADRITRELRPEEWLNRMELTKMIAVAFGLKPAAQTTYQDVPKDSWYRSYASIAQHYLLFPDDTNAFAISPLKLANFHEVVKAVQAAVQAQERTMTQREFITRVYVVGGKAVHFVSALEDPTVLYVAEPDDQAALPSPDDLKPSIERLRTQVLELVNVRRVQGGLHPLAYHPLLEQSAQQYALDMERLNFFSHVSPTGQTLKQRMEATGYYNRTYSPDCNCVKGIAIAENLAKGQSTAADVFKSWMASPKHKAAILTPEYTETGIGVAPDTHYWVQHFGGTIFPGIESIRAAQ